jgi:uncharacterized cupredoxin-like copper-binding protein
MGRTRILGIVLAVALTALGSSANAAPAQPAATSTVTVTMTEFAFKLSKKTVVRGTVLFRVTNRGTVTHNFRIAGKSTRRLAPGASQTLRVVFSKAGRYRYLCTLPSHAPAGMRGVLTVR